MKRITLKLSDDLHARLVALAEKEHRSVQAQLVVLVEQATKDTDPDKKAT